MHCGGGNKSLFKQPSLIISLLLSYNSLVFSEVLHACSLTRLFALASNCESPEGRLSKLNPQTKTMSASPLCHHTNSLTAQSENNTHILNLV